MFYRSWRTNLFDILSAVHLMLVRLPRIPFRPLVVLDGPNVILISRTETDGSRVIVSCIILCESEHLNT